MCLKYPQEHNNQNSCCDRQTFFLWITCIFKRPYICSSYENIITPSLKPRVYSCYSLGEQHLSSCDKLTNLKPDSLQPHILVLRADLAASHDGVPSCLHPPGHLLQPGSCNPPGGVLGVGRDHRLEEEASLLHITVYTRVSNGRRLSKMKAREAVEKTEVTHLMSPVFCGVMLFKSVR